MLVQEQKRRRHPGTETTGLRRFERRTREVFPVAADFPDFDTVTVRFDTTLS
jgi:hypothetical protein